MLERPESVTNFFELRMRLRGRYCRVEFNGKLNRKFRGELDKARGRRFSVIEN